mmetsp:Transcript_11345/g.17061  ORF Transcript_11345/g.17061 Transcript_11345/m.17061 type:complete len:383 (-) Transcript_11345:211-1359(-)
MQLTAARDDVLAGLGDLAAHHGVRLGQLLQALHQFRQVGRVLHGHRDSHHRRHGELHGLDAAGRLAVGDGARLDQELIHADDAAGVAGRDVGHGLGGAAHHDHDSLDGLHEQVGLLAGLVVGAQDTHLLARADLAGEHAPEGREAVVSSGDHLGHVHHERGRVAGVAGADGVGGLVVHGSVVQGLHTVGLCGGGRRQVQDDHLQHGLSGGQPLLHDVLEQCLPSQSLLLLLVEDHAHGLGHVEGLGLTLLRQLVVHHGLEHVDDGVHDEGHEGSFGAGVAIHAAVGVHRLRGDPLVLAVHRGEHPVAPQLLRHLLSRCVELGSIDSSETLQRKSPLVQTRSEGHVAVHRHHLPVLVAESVRFNYDVDVFDGFAHILVDLLSA